MYMQYNPNPDKFNVGDSTVRAIGDVNLINFAKSIYSEYFNLMEKLYKVRFLE